MNMTSPTPRLFGIAQFLLSPVAMRGLALALAAVCVLLLQSLAPASLSAWNENKQTKIVL
jgi:hypothetical protein